MKPTAVSALAALSTLLPRFGRRSTLVYASSLRMEIRPPSLCHAPEGLWNRLMFWLLAPAPHEAAPPLNRLPAVRFEFVATLSDIDSDEADALRARIGAARSLRELWHLRSEVYRLVGITFSQDEADRRLALLAPHFPTRAPRSQLAPL
jgi:hypothetical protein